VAVEVVEGLRASGSVDGDDLSYQTRLGVGCPGLSLADAHHDQRQG
jgi:hypothetical protein